METKAQSGKDETPVEEGKQPTAGSTASSEVETKHGELVSRAESLYKELGNLFSGSLKLAENGEEVERVLDDVSFEGIARFLKSDKCKNVITMAGAGISTSAGIPDFRSPGSGLYDNLQKYNLPTPTSIFDVDFYKENPEPFCQLAKDLWPGGFKPTPCHYFIKQLNDKGRLLRHYTQNIDGLELLTGLPEDKVVEAHGHFRSAHCIECQKPYTEQWLKDNIFAEKIPKCETTECTGLVKPDIVFFGDKLPNRFLSCMHEDFNKCDLLIIMGTSLSVQPFSSLPQRVSKKTPRLLINMDKGNTEMDPFIAMFIGGCSMDFDSDANYRDVFRQGTCDNGCMELSQALDWVDEPKAVVGGKAYEKFDSKRTTEKEVTRASAEASASASQTKPTSTSTNDVKPTVQRSAATPTRRPIRAKSSGKPARTATSAKLPNKRK